MPSNHDPRLPAKRPLPDEFRVLDGELIDDDWPRKDMIEAGRADLRDRGYDPDDWVDFDTDEMLKRATPDNTRDTVAWGWGRAIKWCGRTGRRHDPMAVNSVRQYIKDHWTWRRPDGSLPGRYGRQPYSPGTVETAVYVLSMVYDRMGMTNPVRDPRVGLQLAGYRETFEEAGYRTDEADPLTPEQSVLLARSCDLATVNGLRNAAMFRLQFDTGCRADEMCKLTLQDVAWLDEQRAEVTFVRTKGRKARTVAVQATPGIDWDVDPCRLLLGWYRAVLSAGYAPPGPLFRQVHRGDRRKDYDETGVLGGRILAEQITYHDYALTWHRALTRTKLGIDPVSGLRTRHYPTHANRAGLITALADAGVPLEKVAARTGHSPASPVIHQYFRSERKWGDDNMGALVRRAKAAGDAKDDPAG